jgi:hypothetical protein
MTSRKRSTTRTSMTSGTSVTSTGVRQTTHRARRHPPGFRRHTLRNRQITTSARLRTPRNPRITTTPRQHTPGSDGTPTRPRRHTPGTGGTPTRTRRRITQPRRHTHQGRQHIRLPQKYVHRARQRVHPTQAGRPPGPGSTRPAAPAVRPPEPGRTPTEPGRASPRRTSGAPVDRPRTRGSGRRTGKPCRRLSLDGFPPMPPGSCPCQELYITPSLTTPLPTHEIDARRSSEGHSSHQLLRASPTRTQVALLPHAPASSRRSCKSPEGFPCRAREPRASAR